MIFQISKKTLKKLLPNPILNVAISINRGIKKSCRFVKTFWRYSIFIKNTRFQIPLLAELATDSNLRISEHWMASLLEVLKFNDEAVFFDVGGNVGQTLLSIKSIYPTSTYFGFEPNPACVFYMQQLVKKNNLENTTVVPVGLSDSNTTKQLWITENSHTGSGSTFSQIKDLKNKVPSLVPVFKLDTICADLLLSKQPSLIKVDVEGHESEAIRGALQIIADSKPILIVELLPPRSALDTKRLTIRDELQKIVEELNYIIFSIQKTQTGDLLGLKKLQSFPSSVVLAEESAETRDYLLVHSSRESELESINDQLNNSL